MSIVKSIEAMATPLGTFQSYKIIPLFWIQYTVNFVGHLITLCSSVMLWILLQAY
jgi:hypothetical protein